MLAEILHFIMLLPSCAGDKHKHVHCPVYASGHVTCCQARHLGGDYFWLGTETVVWMETVFILKWKTMKEKWGWSFTRLYNPAILGLFALVVLLFLHFPPPSFIQLMLFSETVSCSSFEFLVALLFCAEGFSCPLGGTMIIMTVQMISNLSWITFSLMIRGNETKLPQELGC